MTSSRFHDLETYLDIEECENRAGQKNTLFRLVRLIFKHRKVLFSGFIAITLGTSVSLLEPRIFGYAIDEVIIPKRGALLNWVAGFYLLVTCVRIIATILQSYLFELLGQRVTQDLRVILFSHLERMPIAQFDKNPAGRLLTRVTNDVAALNEMFSAGFVSMLCNVLLVIGILAGMLILDFKLGLIASSVFPVLVVAAAYFSGRLRVAYRNARSKLSALNAFLAENLSGIKVVHLFNRQKLHLDRFLRLNEWYRDAQVSSIKIFALFQPSITVSAGVSIGLVIWFGGGQVLTGHLKLGVLVAFFSYVVSLFQPVREIADKWNIFLSGMASAERIFAILDWPTELESRRICSEARPISDLLGNITFENVYFAYEGENWILRDFSLTIQAGERIGIVGHTGAGKTTLISLLMRFYEPQKGRILLDGKDLKEYDIRSLRASIGIVQQDVFLFSGSFEENITFWREGATVQVDAILSALKIKRHQDKTLQERGGNYSSGERQTIAFARAMAADPKIWILDEATSNMDSESEMDLQRALAEATVNRTSILIAHRLATVRRADRIIVLHRGAAIESGNHDALMEKNGLYARLYRYQEIQLI